MTAHRGDDAVERFWAWIEAEPTRAGGGLAAMLHHLQTFWDRRHLGNVAVFHYGDLEADLAGEMRRLAQVLDVNVPEGTWPSLVAAATFDSMRSRADELAPQVKVAGFWHDNTRFFHRGQSGQWRALMTDEGVARYAARVRELSRRTLRNGRTTVGGPAHRANCWRHPDNEPRYLARR